MMSSPYPASAGELSRKRSQLAPETFRAFRDFSTQVFRSGALPVKVKELIAVAVAHVTQCPYCIAGHARRARDQGATEEELMEAVWIAAEMRAGAAFAHSLIALHALEDASNAHPPSGRKDE
jgi:AhpD family alkylhydroperoxidase